MGTLIMYRLVTVSIIFFLNISVGKSSESDGYKIITQYQTSDGRWPKYWTRTVGEEVTQLTKSKIRSLHNDCRDLPNKSRIWGEEEVNMCRREVSTAIALVQLFRNFSDEKPLWEARARKAVESMQFNPLLNWVLRTYRWTYRSGEEYEKTKNVTFMQIVLV